MVVERVGVSVSINVRLTVAQLAAAAILVDAELELDVAPLARKALRALIAGLAGNALLDVRVDVLVRGVPVAGGHVEELLGAHRGDKKGRRRS